LRGRVEVLLDAYQHADDVPDAPLVEIGFAPPGPSQEQPGTVIGRYKLLERIGEGGMAVVYMAEQERPVRRKVALKIIKLGMDTRQVIARFEAERQALAMMDHPNIAKIYDAGATETGRPYFVMELVKGTPVTKFCDEHRFTTRQRLELFVAICQAVQHAHQKGIIHRDLKPSNVLVTLHDGRPVPKIIDFGIAKATSKKLTEKTLFTQYEQLIGTPEYMSPEQAEWSGLDIDTRTDIYSLGVLLYELLTGSTPFDAKALRESSYSRMQEIIRTQEPTKPSTKLHALGETLADVADRRKTTADTLQKQLRGDLDWIIMKALEKDRGRRYGTATELAADVEHHLNSEPVQAAAPTLRYRLGKFVAKNRAGVITSAVIAVAVIVGLSAALTGLYQARKQYQRAEANFENARAAVDAMTRFAEDTLYVPGMQYLREALLGEAIGFYEEFLLEQDPRDQLRIESAEVYTRIGQLHLARGSQEEARTAFERAISLIGHPQPVGNLDAYLVNAWIGLGRILGQSGQTEEAIAVLETGRSMSRSPGAQYRCDREITAIRRAGTFERTENLLASLTPEPNELGIWVLRMGAFAQPTPDGTTGAGSWMRSPVLRSDWYKRVPLPPEAMHVVVPNDAADVEGGGEVNPDQYGYGCVFQMVRSHTEFDALAEPMYITRVELRPDKKVGAPYIVFFEEQRMWLSTTNASPDNLSRVFADNRGHDVVCVEQGMVVYSAAGMAGAGPKEWSLGGGLERPFFYDKNAGNLTLEVRTATGSDRNMGADGPGYVTEGGWVFAVGDEVTEASAGSRHGGLVWRFTFVPEEVLLNDRSVCLEVFSPALLTAGAVKCVQLRVQALKRSGLAPTVTNETVYTCDRPSVVAVTAEGLILPVSPGVCTIRLEYTDPHDQNKLTESVVVEVLRVGAERHLQKGLRVVE